MRIKRKAKKLTTRLVSGILAVAMTFGITASMPEMDLNVSGYNTQEQTSSYKSTNPTINKSSKSLLSIFGNLNNTTSEYSSIVASGNVSGNFYEDYGDYYSEGYNFTMSNIGAYDAGTQVLDINGTEYTNTSSHIAAYYASGNTAVETVTSSNGYSGGYSVDTSSSTKSYTGTPGVETDSDGNGYIIRLRDKTYNTSTSYPTNDQISYRYNNVGTYTDDNGTTYEIDVKLTVQDYAVEDDYVALYKSSNGQYVHSWAMVTKTQHDNLSTTLQNLCVAQSNAMFNISGYRYAVPMYNYSAFADAGGWAKIGQSTKRYSTNYGAVISFTTDKVGINTEWIDWIKVKYTFYISGTDTVKTVKGQTTWKDIDYSQGVSFAQSQIDDNKITPTVWESQTEKNNFLKKTWTYTNNSGDSSHYVAYVDPYYRVTEMSDTEAWMSAIFNTNSFVTIYSFGGRWQGTRNDNTYTSNAVHGVSGGTIQSDLPGASPTGTIRITKEFTFNGGSETYKTADLVAAKILTPTDSDYNYRSQYIKGLTYKIKTSSGKYVVATYNGEVDYKYTGLTSDPDVATTFRLFYSSTSEDYRVILTNAPQGNYYVEETIGTVTSIGTTTVKSNYIGRGTDETTATVTNKKYLSSRNSNLTTASKSMTLTSAPSVNTNGSIKSNGSLSGLYVRYTNNIDLYGSICVYKYVDKSVVTTSEYSNLIKFALYDQTAGKYINLTDTGSEYKYNTTEKSAQWYSMQYHSSANAYVFKVNGLDSTHLYKVYEQVTSDNGIYQTSMNFYEVTDNSKSSARSWKSGSGTSVSNIKITSDGYSTKTRYVYINNPSVENNTLNIYKSVKGYTKSGTSQVLCWTSGANITTNMYNLNAENALSKVADAYDLKYYIKNSSGQYLVLTQNSDNYTYTYSGTTTSYNSATKVAFNYYMYNRTDSYDGAATITGLPDDTYYIFERYSGDGAITAKPVYYNKSKQSTATSGTTYASNKGVEYSLSNNSTHNLTFTNEVESTAAIEVNKYEKVGSTVELVTGTNANMSQILGRLWFYIIAVDTNGNPYVLAVNDDNALGTYYASKSSFEWNMPTYINCVTVGGSGSAKWNGVNHNCLMRLDTQGKLTLTINSDLLELAEEGYKFYLHEVWYTNQVIGTSDLNDYSNFSVTNEPGTQENAGMLLSEEQCTSDPYSYGLVGTGQSSPEINIVAGQTTVLDIENQGPPSLTITKRVNTIDETDSGSGEITVSATGGVLASATKIEEVNESLRFYIKCTYDPDSSSSAGKYYIVKYNEETGHYELNGLSSTLTESCYIKLNSTGTITIDSTNNTHYGSNIGYYFPYDSEATVYEKFVEVDVNDDGEINASDGDITEDYMNSKYSTSNQDITFTDSTTGMETLTFVNNEGDRPLLIIKDIEGIENTVEETSSDVVGTSAYYPSAIENIRFFMRENSGRGNFMVFDDQNNYVGTSYTLTEDCYLKLDENGSLWVHNLPDDDEIIIYETTLDSSLSSLITTNKTSKAGALSYNNISTVYGYKRFLYTTVTFTDTPKTGNITVQKTTDLDSGEKVDLEGIEFRIKGTSYLGYEVDEIITTDENGYAESGDIYVGEYMLTEVDETVPDGLSKGGLVLNEKVLVDNMGYYTDYDGNKYAGDEYGNLLVDGQTGEYTYALAGEDDSYAFASSGVAVTTDTTASYTYYNYKSYMDVNLQKVTNADDVDNPITDLSGITFTISGTSYVGIEVNESVTTGTDGLAEFEHLPSGVYTVTEDLGSRADDFAGYADVGINGSQTWTITLDDENNGQTLDYEYWNYYTEISLTKLGHNAKGENEKLTGVTFSVFSDVDGDGEYDDSVDKQLYYVDKNKSGSFEEQYDELFTSSEFELLNQVDPDKYKEYKELLLELTLVEDPNDLGYYYIEGIPFGNYFVKETALGDNEIRFGIEDTYFAVTIDANETQIEIVTKDDEGYDEEAFINKPVYTQSITLTKRIKVDEIDGSIWYEHGTPTFVLELTNTDDGITYRHSYEFTEDYVNANKFEKNGVEYVEMSYTWDELPAAHYTATELNTTRYTLEDIINISDTGTKVEQTKTDDNVNTIWAVEFEAVADSESYATFYNVKNTYKDLSDNCIVVNDII